MNSTLRINGGVRHVVVATSLLLMSFSALAQWQWIDKDGRKVFSDQSPPADIPANKILKSPGGRAVSVAVTTAAAPETPASGAAVVAAKASASAPSGKDKELDEKKKAAEAAEAQKKKAEEEKLAKARADNCAKAKQAKAGYDSGVRVATTNAKGEREIMDDTARAAESKRLQGIMDTDCKPG